MTEVVIDLKGILEDTPEITVGELFKDHIVPALPKAKYLETTSSLFIVLPWVDGEYDDNWNPCIKIIVKPSNKISATANVECRHGIVDARGNDYVQNMSYAISVTGSGNSGDITKIYLGASNKFVWREHKQGSTRCYGLATTNRTASIIRMSMNVMVTSAKTIKDDGKVNVELLISTESNSILNYVVGSSVYSSQNITRWNLPTRENSISIYQLNDGIIYNDEIMIGFPQSHTSLKNVCAFSDTSPDENKQTTWNINALNLNGINFDVKLSSSGTSTTIVWMIKHSDN